MASIAKLAKLARSHLAPSGVMRAGINLSNVLLVTGADARGAPIGVAPDMAAELARRLGVPVQLEPFAHPDVLCEAATAKRWDIALVGADPARAEHIAFSPAYCEIQCTYLVRANDRSRFASPADVDVPGARIAVKGGGAYDLWLARHLRHARHVVPHDKRLHRRIRWRLVVAVGNFHNYFDFCRISVQPRNAEE